MAKKSNTKSTANQKSEPVKKSDLDNLILADGKKIEDPDITKIKEMEEILGIKSLIHLALLILKFSRKNSQK